jgi:hypothetical protein
MRGVTLPSVPSRIRGRAALLRRLHGLARAAWRFGQHRARTPDEQHFAAVLLDGLTATLAAVSALNERPRP